MESTIIAIKVWQLVLAALGILAPIMVTIVWAAFRAESRLAKLEAQFSTCRSRCESDMAHEREMWEAADNRITAEMRQRDAEVHRLLKSGEAKFEAIMVTIGELKTGFARLEACINSRSE